MKFHKRDEFSTIFCCEFVTFNNRNFWGWKDTLTKKYDEES